MRQRKANLYNPPPCLDIGGENLNKVDVSYNLIDNVELMVSSEMEWAEVAMAMPVVEDDKHTVVDSDNLTKAQKRTYVESLQKADVALLEAMKHLSRAKSLVNMSLRPKKYLP